MHGRIEKVGGGLVQDKTRSIHAKACPQEGDILAQERRAVLEGLGT